MTEPLTLSEARLAVLELTVAALIAQLPPASREEVASLLTYVAGLTDGTEAVFGSAGEEQLANVRHWANEMLSRAMVSRKPSRPESLDPEEAVRRRYVGERSIL